MKILTGIDIPFIPFGGSPIICNDWYSNLPEDVEVRFLTLPPNDPKFDCWWTMKDVVFLDVEKKRSVEEYPEYLEKLKAALLQQIEEYKPDVIHCQHLNFGFSRAIADLDIDIPKIGICHGTDVQIAGEYPFFLENLKKICEGMDMLVFPAQNMADDFFKLDPTEKKHIIIPHGIPDVAYVKRTKPFSTQPLRVLHAGRLNTFKGGDIAVETMKYLKNKNITLKVIGRQDETGFMDKLDQIVADNDLGKVVTFEDQLSRQELFDVMNDYDVMLFPSRSLEAFSMTTIEAQAHGLPVIYAKDGGGIENAVGDSGFRIEDNNPKAWTDQILEIYEHPELLEKYQALGYENAERHRLSKLRDKYFEISRDLM